MKQPLLNGSSDMRAAAPGHLGPLTAGRKQRTEEEDGGKKNTTGELLSGKMKTIN